MANVVFESRVLLNDDEQTPISMIGKKMLPIFATAPNQCIEESLDIIDYICKHYDFSLEKNDELESQVDNLLKNNRGTNYGLSMPRWVNAPLKEFATDTARQYFIEKKTSTIGDFDTALANTSVLQESLSAGLEKDAQLFKQLTVNPKSLASIILFSGLYGIRYVESFDWPRDAENFMLTMAELTHLSLLK